MTREMLRRIAVALLAVMAAAALPAAAPAAGRCDAKGSRTVAENGLVRVYVKRDAQGDRRLYGCRRATGRRMLVAAEYDDGYVLSSVYRDVRLAGRFVAVVTEDTDISCKADCPEGYDGTTTGVTVADVRARRTRGAVGDPDAGSLLLSRRGVAAWLETFGADAELRVLDGAGRGRLVDSGAIDGVGLRGLRLGWRNAGVPRGVDLTPF
jgi:hypothetical protein